MRFPRNYRDIKVDIAGYDLTFNVLSNPTNRELDGFLNARSYESEEDAAREAVRQQFGELLVVFFGKSQVESFDFSHTEAAIATIESDDLPYDIKFWLKQAPLVAVRQMQDDIRKNLFPS